MDERARDQLMCSCLPFEVHIDDVVILVEYRGQPRLSLETAAGHDGGPDSH